MKAAVLAALAGCHAAAGPAADPPAVTVAAVRVAWPDGCLAIAVDGRVVDNDDRACGQPRPPYATLALATDLIGADTGGLAVDRGLAMLRYGDPHAAPGGVTISGRAQLAFLDGLVHGTLSATRDAQAVVRAGSELARCADGVILHGRTGGGPLEDAPDGGDPAWLVWQVGWIERRDGSVVPYAGWLERRGASLAAARDVGAQRLAAALRQLGLFTPCGRAARP